MVETIICCVETSVTMLNFDGGFNRDICPRGCRDIDPEHESRPDSVPRADVDHYTGNDNVTAIASATASRGAKVFERLPRTFADRSETEATVAAISKPEHTGYYPRAGRGPRRRRR